MYDRTIPKVSSPGRAWSLITTALALVGAMVVLVTVTPLARWIAGGLSGPWSDEDRGVLVVLGGSVVEDPSFPGGSMIGESSYWRAIDAVSIWQQGHFRTIVLVGAGTAEPMMRILETYGVPPASIILETRSRNTHENALFSKPILNRLSGPIVLLTSDYHMFRASRCFSRAGIDVVTRPAPDAVKRSNSHLLRWPVFCELTEELGKIVYYRVRGWI